MAFRLAGIVSVVSHLHGFVSGQDLLLRGSRYERNDIRTMPQRNEDEVPAEVLATPRNHIAIGIYGQMRSYSQHHEGFLDIVQKLVAANNVVIAWNVSLQSTVAAFKKSKNVDENAMLQDLNRWRLSPDSFKEITKIWSLAGARTLDDISTFKNSKPEAMPVTHWQFSLRLSLLKAFLTDEVQHNYKVKFFIFSRPDLAFPSQSNVQITKQPSDNDWSNNWDFALVMGNAVGRCVLKTAQRTSFYEAEKVLRQRYTLNNCSKKYTNLNVPHMFWRQYFDWCDGHPLGLPWIHELFSSREISRWKQFIRKTSETPRRLAQLGCR